MRADEVPGPSRHGVERVEGLDGIGSDMSRIISISDGVFAFSMTFLVIDLVLPQKLASGSYPNLAGYLGGEWPAMVVYALSFFIIATWWSGHRQLFSPIVRYDRTLVVLNNLFLMIIAVTPFLVGILYYYGPGATFGVSSPSAQLAVAVYASVQGAGGLILLGVWRYSTRDHRLVRPSLPAAWIRATEQSRLAGVVVFFASVPVAFAAPLVSELMWVLMIVGIRRIVRRPLPVPAGTTDAGRAWDDRSEP